MSKKRKRGYPLPDFVESEPTICFRMEVPDYPEYRQAVVGALSELGKWFNWQLTDFPDDRRATLTAEVFRSKLYNTFRWEQCMCNCDELNNIAYYNQQSQNQVINHFRMEAYDGTNQSVDADAPDETTDDWNYSGTSVEDNALCNAVKGYVERIMLEYYNRLIVNVGLAAVTAGVLGWLTGGIGAVLGGAIVLAIGIELGMVQEAINDKSAMNAMICKLTEELKGRPATREQWDDAIDDTNAEGDNEATIKAVLQKQYERDENFLLFLAMAGEAKRMVAAGQDLCPCGDTWCYTWDFPEDGQGTWGLRAGWENLPGVFVGGQGWEAANGSVQSGQTTIGLKGVSREIDFSTRTITRFRVEYDYVKGNTDFNGGAAMGLTINDANVVLRTFSQMPGSETGRVDDWTGSIAAQRAGFTIYSSRDQSSPYTYGGSVRVFRVIMEGTGSNPFGDDNCEEE